MRMGLGQGNIMGMGLGQENIMGMGLGQGSIMGVGLGQGNIMERYSFMHSEKSSLVLIVMLFRSKACLSC